VESRAKLFGHSIHQQLVALPLGMLAAAVLFDFVGVVSGHPLAAEVAYWVMGAGIAFGVVAAAFGLIDVVAIPAGTRAARIGWLHGVGNTVVVSLFIGSWFIRRLHQHQATDLALFLSFSGAALVLITAWLGGELVSRLGIGVSDGAHPNAPSSLDDRPRREAPLP